eukprot:2353094-Prymnesium_polylepis.1
MAPAAVEAQPVLRPAHASVLVDQTARAEPIDALAGARVAIRRPVAAHAGTDGTTVRRPPLCPVLQVGANDHSGNSNGKDYGLLATSSGWNSLLIEPMPSAYDRLVERYRTTSRVRLMNAAVCDSCNSQAQARRPHT